MGGPMSGETQDEVALRETFGLARRVEPEVRLRVAKAVAVVAAGDRVLTAIERAWWLGLLHAMGMPADQVARLAGYEPAPEELASLLDATVRPHARRILHDALRVARADGLHPGERALAEEMALRLGLDAATVDRVERLLALDERFRARRLATLFPGQPRPAPSDYEGHIRMELRGWGSALPPAVALDVAKAILAIAAADGALSADEAERMRLLLRAQGLDEEARAALAAFEPHGVPPESLLDAMLRPFGRLIVYEALRVTQVDGRDARESEAIRRAAAAMGLDEAVVPALVDLADDARALHKARALMLGD